MLYSLIRSAQAGNSDAVIELIQILQPILRKYTYKLHTEDAYDELICFLLDIIYTISLEKFKTPIDFVFIRYFSKSIHSYYTKQVQKCIMDKQIIPFSCFNEIQCNLLENVLLTFEDDDNLILYDLKRTLTDKEFIVIYGVYYLGYSISDLSKELSTSRQNINQIKRYALNKLKKKWSRK